MGILLRYHKFYWNALKKKPYFFRLYSEKVPQSPHISRYISKSDANKNIKIELSTVRSLERLSLVNFGNYEGIKILETSIKFAETLLSKDTEGIQPLSSVLEKRYGLIKVYYDIFQFAQTYSMQERVATN